MIDVAYAIAGGGGGASQGLGAFIPLILIFVVFYFLLIRPQQVRIKKHREFIQNLKKGDTVVTAGGLYGKITGLTDTIVTLEIAENIRVKVSRNQIAALGETSK